MKDEIFSRDSKLHKEYESHNTYSKLVDTEKSEVQKVQKQLQEAELVVKRNNQEIASLKNTLAEAEGYRKSQQQELEVIKNQRDILAQQIVKKKKEILLLAEKNKIAKSVRKKRHYDYINVTDEISILKKSIVIVYDQINLCKEKVCIIPELKREKIKLESELNKLEIKSRALSDDCMVKVNIHNYNNLMKTNPEV